MPRHARPISESTSALQKACGVSSRPAAEPLTALAEVLRARGTRWYLFGAQAVIIWGAPRMSADVDVTVEIEPEEADGFITLMEEAGFELRIRDVEEFVARTRVLPFLHLETEIPMDVVLAGPGLEELFLDRAHQVEVAGTTIPVISPEDLIVTKILAGRPKDIDDVSGILRERKSSLNLDLIRETLGLLDQALDRSDLSALLEAELKKLGD
jgi:hypothetical protein